MKNRVCDEVYNKQKEKIIRGFYVDLLCEILLLHNNLQYKDISKKDVLSELPSLREFKGEEVEKIYKDSLKMLSFKYNIKVIGTNPLKFIEE